MATETVQVLIEGGKATAAPPLGPALGPLGVNIGKVVSDINVKTQSFKGMQVPVKVSVNKETKEYTISIGTPPASQLVLKEAGVAKGSGNPNAALVADLKIEQIIKISKMKQDALLGKNTKMRVKEIMGTCQSMGIMVEGKPVPEAFKDLEAGKFDEKIRLEKTELTAAELKELEEEKKRLQKEIEEKRTEYTKKAKDLVTSLAGKTNKEIRKALVEAGIPMLIINEVAPEEKAEAGAAKK